MQAEVTAVFRRVLASTGGTKQNDTMAKMRKYLIIICVVVILGAGGGTYLLIKHKQLNASKTAVFGSSDVKVSQKEDLYLPSRLPEGYEINQNSVKSPEDTKEVVLIELKSQSGPSIFVSQQPLPKDFSDKKFLPELKDKEDFQVGVGRASIGKINGGTSTMVSVVTDKQWIIINGPSEVPKESFKLIAEGLKK